MNLSLSDIARLTGGKLIKETPEISISGVNTLADACSGDASFLGNEKYFNDFLGTKAGVVLVPPALPEYPEGVAFVEVENPSLAFNALVEHFMKAATDFTPGIHPTAVVDPSAKLNPDKVRIAAGAVIEADVEIGDGSDIGPGCVINKAVTIGRDCKFYARVVVRERCIIGNNVVIQPGAVIGADGFGFLLNKETGRYDTVDQVGIVVIEDHVDIGANTTIDRARFGRTIIGEGTKIDNQIQIGHNCVVGKHTVMCAQSGVAGSTKIGDYVTVAAQVGITGHIKIGDKAVMAARSGVIADLEGGKVYWGAPAVPFGEARKQFAAIRRLPEAFKELNALKKKAEEIQELINQALNEQQG
ncbi:MAG: UDP-3-O-(3-hydroxymyristoyl)glucosamine N-acyltransferase [Akkermansia sp.]|nr:UDP-3-O-(3-hydroxymyristoyl)glucosamine N-acyltransferase [Akkermansia sp.]